MNNLLFPIVYSLLKTIQFICRFTPHSFHLYLGKLLGTLAYLLSIHRKALTRANLSLILGKNERKLAMKVFQNLGMNLIEFISLPFLSQEKLRKLCFLKGKENLTNALKQGKGVVLLTAHLGNWELIGARLALEGFEVISPARPQGKFEEEIYQIRKTSGYKTISVEEGILSLLPLLKKGCIIAILNDQNILFGGIKVPFFGIAVSTPPGAAILALRSGAIVLPTFDVRIGNRHIVYIGSPIPLIKNGNFRGDVIKNTTKFNETIEEWIRKYPEQWLWSHHRWRKVQ
ncbi:MAG: lysophospholipid acyltransferase family protein [bacterium]